MTDFLKEITTILSDRFGAPNDLLSSQTHLREDINLSDIEISEIVSVITQKFSLTLPQDLDVKSLQTVDDLANLVENYSQEL